mmetsp:Transcript_22500/g.51875  ORF Transcript_22500/g.51875 Transcript_22500/m.51875 type:complete len:210 (+) Transcript_22500:549-1178(+)
MKLQLCLLALLHGNHHLLHSSQHVQFQSSHSILHLRRRFCQLSLQCRNLFLEIFNLSLMILVGIRATPTGGTLNFLEQIATAPLELLVVKGDVLGCVDIEIGIPDRLGLHLAEPIEIQLPSKGRKLVMIKILGNDRRGKQIRILHHKHFAVRSPGKGFKETETNRRVRGDTPLRISANADIVAKRENLPRKQPCSARPIPKPTSLDCHV